jgi:hypothetical protein
MRNKARKNNYIASLIYDEGLRYVRKVTGGGGDFHVCDALRRSIVMSPQGLFAPCIEFTNESQPMDNLLKHKEMWFARVASCNKSTPCFYNCVREIGILWHKKWQVFMHFPAIIGQMIKYGNFL